MKIAIGIPAYNEEKNIASIILEIKKQFDEIIVCDDGSTDHTKEILEKLNVTMITHPKNLGYGAAIRSIFLKAKEMSVDILVTFDADGQHRIEDIDKMLKPVKEDKAEIVIGSRFLGNKQEVPKYREIGIKAITSLTNITTGSKISDSQSGFRAYSKKVLEEISPSESGMGISTEILIKAAKRQMRIFEVPIVVSYDGETSTHNPVSHGTSVIMTTIKFVALERPLTFYGIPGVGFLLVGIFFLAWTLQLFGELGRVVTNVALVGLGGIILGVILLITSVILFSMINLVREQKGK